MSPDTQQDQPSNFDLDGNDFPTVIDEGNDNQPKTKRQRQYKSWVWKHLTRIGVVDGKEVCKCNYCKAQLTCGTKGGTSHLDRHLNLVCPYYIKESKCHNILKFTNPEHGSTLTTWKFEQERSRDDLMKWIISSELPFKVVENRRFRIFTEYLQPKFKVLSRFTVKRDCMKFYEIKKLKLRELLKTTGRICITTDMWTSIQNLGYMSITAHFIDNQWKLHKKIICFCVLYARHTGDNIADMIVSRLSEWNIESLCTITVDNASTNDVVVRNLIDHFATKDSLLLDGTFFHVRCWAHIINLVVQDGLLEVKDITTKIRGLVKYVKYSTRRFQDFKDIAQQEHIPITKGLRLDVSTRWNSTYLMLESAILYQKVFNHLKSHDFQLADAPSASEWKKVEMVCEILESFYVATKVFSGQKYSTANLFFSLIYEIERHLQTLVNHADSSIRSMGTKMYSKFDKYWRDKNAMMPLAIAIVLDPRYKFDFLRFSYLELYPEVEAIELVERVRDIFHRLYAEYSTKYASFFSGESSTTGGLEQENAFTSKKKEDVRSKFLKKKREIGSLEVGKSEIDMYLEDCSADIIDDDKFDILKWWDVNSSKYRILSFMARDILAIPVSSVASESAFSTGGRVLDPYRSRLVPKTVEVLVCLGDWIHEDDEADSDLDEQEEEEQVDEDLLDPKASQA